MITSIQRKECEFYRLYQEDPKDFTCGICLSSLRGRISIYHTGKYGFLHPTCLVCQVDWFAKKVSLNQDDHCHLCRAPLRSEQIKKMISCREIEVFSQSVVAEYLSAAIVACILQKMRSSKEEGAITSLGAGLMMGSFLTMALTSIKVLFRTRMILENKITSFMGVFFLLSAFSTYVRDCKDQNLDFLRAGLVAVQIKMLVRAFQVTMEYFFKIEVDRDPEKELCKKCVFVMKNITAGALAVSIITSSKEERICRAFLVGITMSSLVFKVYKNKEQIEDMRWPRREIVCGIALLARKIAAVPSPL